MAKDLKNILLSQEEENKIKAKTPDKLPLNPTAQGWSGQEVRRFLAKSLIDNEGSFLAEFKKKMEEIKTQFEDVFGEGDGDIQGQIDSIIQNIEEVEATASSLATTVLNNSNTLNLKVDKTLTILGIDLQDDITLSEFKIALGDATLFANGLMSALDKQNLAQTMIDIQSLFSVKADKTVLTSTIQAVTDLQANKLNKIWADITEQTTTNLTDILVFNRGSNVYKTTIANLLSHVAVVDLFTVEAELPEIGLPNKIYLVPSSDPETQNTLDEFIWVNNDWERIGGISVDLSNYFNKTEINSMLDDVVSIWRYE